MKDATMEKKDGLTFLRISFHPAGAPAASLTNDEMETQFARILERMEPADAEALKKGLIELVSHKSIAGFDEFWRRMMMFNALGAVEDLDKNVWSALRFLKALGLRVDSKNQDNLVEALYRFGQSPTWQNRGGKTFQEFLRDKIKAAARRYQALKGHQPSIRSEYVRELIGLDSKELQDDRTRQGLLASMQISESLSHVSPQQKDILLLDAAFGLSDKEIASYLKTTARTVRSQKSTARKRISRVL